MTTIKNISKYTVVIGIDPDVHLSGVATKKDGQLTLNTMSFFALFDYLATLKGQDVLVRIEAGWLNKVNNYHGATNMKTSNRISNNVGRNHETGRKIEEMCEHLQLKYELVKPQTSKWKPELFKMVTGIETRNQEMIDAGRLVI